MKTIGTESKAIFQTKRLILVAATGVLYIGVAVGATAQAGSPRAQARQSQPGQLETFQGEVTLEPDPGDCGAFRCRESGKIRASSYSLVDELHKGYFFLDGEQTKEPLYKYAGKRVEITGTLDAKARMVHIESIKSIRW
jgi:hypothetical protein